jgi:hypothetical protein
MIFEVFLAYSLANIPIYLPKVDIEVAKGMKKNCP